MRKEWLLTETKETSLSVTLQKILKNIGNALQKIFINIGYAHNNFIPEVNVTNMSVKICCSLKTKKRKQ